jgi:hypothetical protein
MHFLTPFRPSSKVIASFAVAVVTLAPASRAEEASPEAPTPAPGARGSSLAVAPGFFSTGAIPYASLTFVPSYRFGPHFVLAANVSYSYGPSAYTEIDWGPGGTPSGGCNLCNGGGQRFFRASLEPRHVFVLGGATEAWIGGELGVADSITLPLGVDVAHRAAPMLGVGAGVDLYADRFFSLGLLARVETFFWSGDPPEYSNATKGIRGGGELGLAVAFHLPSTQ